MYKIDACPCCNSKQLRSRPALISSFIAAYVLRQKPTLTNLAECLNCGFYFYQSRYLENELYNLYTGYRGKEYFKQRHFFEPWYTQKFNDGIGADPLEISRRKAEADSLIKLNLPATPINDVLDYGGDRGQFIPDIGQTKYVFEISAVETVPGVISISQKLELKERGYDLVLLRMVLEHVNDPGLLLNEVSALLRSHDSLLFIEVPIERPNLSFLPIKGFGRAIYELYLRILLQFPIVLKLADLYSLFSRIKLNIIPPLGFMRMHEHINFFDEASMKELLTRSGLELVGRFERRGDRVLGTSLLCLARLTSTRSRPKLNKATGSDELGNVNRSTI